MIRRVIRSQAARRRLLVVLSLFIGLRLAWLWLPGHLYPLPDTLFETRDYARIVTDNRDNPIRWELGWRESWRFHVPLVDMSPHLIHATLAAEDSRFHAHNGIDWRSVARAVRDNLLSRRVRSGASTLSMQVARMRMPDSPRGWRRKIQQTAWALTIERRYSKNWILAAYLNNAPYGGNIVGAPAAAEKYFSKSVSDLTAAEAALLAGLPQRPSALRPDRYPDRALDRQNYVITRMRTVYPDLYADLTAGFHLQARRSFNDPDTTGALHFCRLALREADGNKSRGSPRTRLSTTLDSSAQALLFAALRRGVSRLEGVKDGGGVIVANASASVIALVGTLDAGDASDGMVNTCAAPRSSGSTLKPFIYAAAIEKGLLLPATRLNDSPLVIGNYKPENYSGEFSGMIPAVDALVQSLNTPAARVLAAVGVGDMIETLERCGFSHLTRGAEDYGLSLALGGGEVTTLELAAAYCGLARKGDCKALIFLKESSALSTASPFSKGTIAMISEMLASSPLPGLAESRGVSWKTGTSNGFRDAWSCAYNQDYTVIIWLGNKNGDAAAGLIGAESALPVAAEVFAGLMRETPSTTSDTMASDSLFEPVRLCEKSGLRAGPFCAAPVDSRGVKGISLRECFICRRLLDTSLPASENTPASAVSAGHDKLTILSPAPQVYFTRESHLSLHVRGSGPAATRWFNNGELLPVNGNADMVDFPLGKHHITAMNPDNGQTASIAFEVKNYD
ncbi:MAG: penicillin-binding protein 1C [Lentisphaeria bacterium]|nr:penicillin-binding protein 1C [Lentisphaeria bacterium]